MTDKTVPGIGVDLPFLESVKDAEKHFLSGRRNRGADLESAVRMCLEFLKGFEQLDIDGPCVTVFGSARFPDGHAYYETARALLPAGTINPGDVDFIHRAGTVAQALELIRDEDG